MFRNIMQVRLFATLPKNFKALWNQWRNLSFELNVYSTVLWLSTIPNWPTNFQFSKCNYFLKIVAVKDTNALCFLTVRKDNNNLEILNDNQSIAR